ncbi:MAG: hypothetical protein R3Y50_06350 [Rikenellaceae bacterium]
MKRLLILYIITMFCSCSSSTTQPTIYTLKIDKHYDTLPDSSYVKSVKCMQFYNDNLYILDAEQQKILEISENFDKVKTIARGGRAANEIMFANSFYLHSDTMFVLDGDRIKYYNSDGYLSYKPIDSDIMLRYNRFAADADYFYLPYKSKEHTFCLLPKEGSGEVALYGSLESLDTEKKTLLRNPRALFQNEKYIVTMANVFAYFEYFDRDSKQMLGRFDFSQLDFMRDNLNFIESKPDKENSYYVLVEDSYMIGNNLFALCSTFQGGYRSKSAIKNMAIIVLHYLNITLRYV